MIYLNDFVAKRENKKVDYDNSFGYQCNDLTRQRLKERWLPQYKKLWANWVIEIARNPDYYVVAPLKRVKNNPRATNQVPKRWDIVIFNKPSVTGHIAIVTASTIGLNSFRVFEQNAWYWLWTWLWGDACKQRVKTYKNVMWWIAIP